MAKRTLPLGFSPYNSIDAASIDSISAISLSWLRIEFMRASPTYELATLLAKKIITKKQADIRLLAMYEEGVSQSRRRGLHSKKPKALTATEKDSLRERFKLVQRTYKEYRDLDRPFPEWFVDIGHTVFDTLYRRTTELVEHYQGSKYQDKFLKSVNSYYRYSFKDPQFYPSILINMPTNLPRKVAMRELKRLVDRYSIKDSQIRVKKPLTGKRHHPLPLLRRYKVLMYKTYFPDVPLWKIGEKLKINKNCVTLMNDPNASAEEIARHRMYIGISCNKALLFAQYIAENAAMDVFPSTKPLLLPVFDYGGLRQRMGKAWPLLYASESPGDLVW